MARTARVEGAASKSVAGERPSVGFRAAVEAFKAEHPDKWEEIARCPTLYGVEVIAEHLEKL